MPSLEDVLAAMQNNPKGIRFSEICRVCDHYFGKPRQKVSSHRLYRTPSPGDPRVNIQNDRGRAKAYQVRQVLQAIEKVKRHELNPR
jgi:hypothetical protein